MEQDFNTLMQKYKEELMRYDAMQRAAGAAAAAPASPDAAAANSAAVSPQNMPPVRARDDIFDSVRQRGMSGTASGMNLSPENPGVTRLQSFGQPEADNPGLNSAAREMRDMSGTMNGQGAKGMPPSEMFAPPRSLHDGRDENMTRSMIPKTDTDRGELVVHVTSASQTAPVEGADVVVARSAGNGGYLIWHDKTDASGNTPPFELPAPPRGLSESPGNAVPYSVYDVRVSSPGFYILDNLDAQVFGGQTSVIDANLTPLPESERNSDEIISIETPPSGLLNT